MNTFTPNHNGHGMRIGIVQARFSNEIGHAMSQIVHDKLTQMGVDPQHITFITVPGALEIPLVLQNMAATAQFDALIALGAVIRGQTYHFELVSNESAAGISAIGQQFNIPIANAVLTTENDEQAHARIREKAEDAAIVAVELANTLRHLNGPTPI